MKSAAFRAFTQELPSPSREGGRVLPQNKAVKVFMCCRRLVFGRPENLIAQANWRRLICRALRVRFLQRVWGNLGQCLQLFGKDTREQLKLLYQKAV